MGMDEISIFAGFIGLVVAGILASLGIRGRLYRSTTPICGNCGYDLRATPPSTRTCPECGAELSKFSQPEYRKPLNSLIFLGIGFGIVSTAFLIQVIFANVNHVSANERSVSSLISLAAKSSDQNMTRELYQCLSSQRIVSEEHKSELMRLATIALNGEDDNWNEYWSKIGEWLLDDKVVDDLDKLSYLEGILKSSLEFEVQSPTSGVSPWNLRIRNSPRVFGNERFEFRILSYNVEHNAAINSSDALSDVHQIEFKPNYIRGGDEFEILDGMLFLPADGSSETIDIQCSIQIELNDKLSDLDLQTTLDFQKHVRLVSNNEPRVEMIDDPHLTKPIHESISVILGTLAVFERSDGQFLVICPTIEDGTAKPPEPLVGRLYCHIGGEKLEVGQIRIAGNGRDINTFYLLHSEDPRIIDMSIEYVPDPSIAERSIGISRIWGGSIRLQEFNWIKDSNLLHRYLDND